MKDLKSRSSLHNWFNRYAKWPLLVGHGIVIGAGLLFAIVVIRNESQFQDSAIADFQQVASRAIVQQNRPMLESLLISFGQRLHAISIGVCADDKELISLMQRTEFCSKRSAQVPLAYAVKTIPLIGTPNYSLFFIAPRFTRLNELLFILTSAFVLVGLNTYLLRSVSRGLWRDLVQPLHGSDLQNIKISEVFDLLSSKEEANELRTKMTVISAIRQVSLQVAHDIRSPLSALNILTKKSAGLTVEERAVLVGAADRINSIASDLLDGDRWDSTPSSLNTVAVGERKPNIMNVAQALHAVIEEKRLQIDGNAKKVHISLVVADQRQLAIGEANRFKRIFSNVLNNSVEAIDGEGFVSVVSEEDGSFIIISVKDNGRGMSPDVLARIGEERFTTKVAGNGLGLATAVPQLRAWGGDLNVSSSESQGTTVQIKLLMAPGGSKRENEV